MKQMLLEARERIAKVAQAHIQPNAEATDSKTDNDPKTAAKASRHPLLHGNETFFKYPESKQVSFSLFTTSKVTVRSIS